MLLRVISMPRLISFGELLIDWIPLDFRTEGDISIPVYGQFPGGAPANSAVAVARLGGEAYFVGQVGKDAAGQYLTDCLNKYRVKTDYLSVDSERKTPMAFVSLDSDGERSFSFHRDNSADVAFKASGFNDELYAENGIFHICSNTLTDEAIAEATIAGLSKAHVFGLLTSFDVNLRFPLWQDLAEIHDRVHQAIQHIDLLKLSLEELVYLAGDVKHDDYLDLLLNSGPKVILLTDGAQPVKVYSGVSVHTITTPTVAVVDTTGAGDAFSGGWLYSLLEQGITNQTKLTQAISASLPIVKAVELAVTCGAFAVTKKGAWSALPTQRDIN